MNNNWTESKGEYRRADGAIVKRLDGKRWAVLLLEEHPDLSRWLTTKNGNKRTWKTPNAAMNCVDKTYPYGSGFGLDGDVVITENTFRGLDRPLHAATLKVEAGGHLQPNGHPVYVLQGGLNLECADAEALELLAGNLPPPAESKNEDLSK